MARRLREFPGLRPFEPRLDSLPEVQRAVWPRLTLLPLDAVLYGGTAIALRLAHRASVDFDLFLPRSFVPDELRRESPLLRDAETVQNAPDTLTVLVDGVRISLFGVRLPAIEWPALAVDIGLPVASLRDLAATKVGVLLGRAEAKDYLDIAALLDSVELEDMLGGAETLFGPPFSSMLALKALTTFDDGDLATLPGPIQARLRDAARRVERVPIVGARSRSVLPPEALISTGGSR
jgi:hypothetical protein